MIRKFEVFSRQTTNQTIVLLPTERGDALISLLPDRLTSPLMTAEWEQRLKEIEHGEADAGAFMHDIRTMLQELVTSAKGGEKTKQMPPPERKGLDKCPGCGGEIEVLHQDAVPGLSPLPDYWQ